MPRFTRETLPNGIRVLYIAMPAFHSAIASVYLRMGPRFESRDQNGISHFVEHMLFKGTSRHRDPEALARAIDACGAELNGATMPEYTELVAGSHSRNFLDALRLLAEVALEPLFEPEHLETERRVVLEEMGQSRDVPGDGVTVDEVVHELMWPGHAHEFQCLGQERIIRSIGADDLRSHYHRFLKGANIVIAVAGNFDHDQVAALLAETFGRLERGQPAAAPALEDGQSEPRHRFMWAPSRMAYVRLCHKAYSYHHPNVFALVILSEVLGGGVTSRLFSRLRERDGLVYDIYSGTPIFHDCGWVEISTTTSRGNVAAAVEAALEETRRIADEGLPDDQLHAIKERLACNLEILQDNPSELAEWMGVRELLLSPQEVITPAVEAARLKEVTSQEVRQVARQVFQPQRRSLAVVGPCPWRQRRRIRRLLAV